MLLTTFQTLVKQIARMEGKNKQVDIVQASEITKLSLQILANIPIQQAEPLLEKYRFERNTR